MIAHRVLLSFLITLLLSAVTLAEPMKVGVAGSAPFVIKNGETVDGISIQIWEAVADIEDVKYDYVMFSSVSEVLEALNKGEVDIAVGPISITSKRAEEFEFSQPYYTSDLGILTHTVEKSWMSHAKGFLKSAFLYGLIFLMAVLTLVGGLVWLAEKKENTEEFPEGPIGLVHGMWFAIVTMTTVGYGDKSPRTGTGRIITAVWMVIATITYSTLTAGIATVLTVQRLDSAAIANPEDMRGERVAVVTGTTGATAAQHFGATELGCSDLEEATDHLVKGHVEAVVFDIPALQYHIQKNPKELYVLSKATFESQNYGFALPRDSKDLHELNVALLTLHESNQIKEISRRWMSSAE